MPAGVVILLALVLILISFLALNPTVNGNLHKGLRISEKFEGLREPTRQELQTLGSKVWSCEKWDGKVAFMKDIAVCALPRKVMNSELLNYQLAGKVCELDYLAETHGCRLPGKEWNPYLLDPSRGYYRLY